MWLLNIWPEWRLEIYTSTYSRFFGATFYFLQSRKFLNYFYFLESRILSKYFYFLEKNKVICFWQHCLSYTTPFRTVIHHTSLIFVSLVNDLLVVRHCTHQHWTTHHVSGKVCHVYIIGVPTPRILPFSIGLAGRSYYSEHYRATQWCVIERFAIDRWRWAPSLVQRSIALRNNKLSYRRGTARRAMSVEILSAAAQVNEKSHFKTFALGEWRLMTKVCTVSETIPVLQSTWLAVTSRSPSVSYDS